MGEKSVENVVDQLVLDVAAARDVLRNATESIRPAGPWRAVEHVEIATLNWVDSYNNDRPHEDIDDLTPITAKELHYAPKNSLQLTGWASQPVSGQAEALHILWIASRGASWRC